MLSSEYWVFDMCRWYVLITETRRVIVVSRSKKKSMMVAIENCANYAV